MRAAARGDDAPGVRRASASRARSRRRAVARDRRRRRRRQRASSAPPEKALTQAVAADVVAARGDRRRDRCAGKSAPTGMQDEITLHAMRFHALVGILPHERDIPQPIEIDLTRARGAGRRRDRLSRAVRRCCASARRRTDRLSRGDSPTASPKRRSSTAPRVRIGARRRAEAARRAPGAARVRRGRRRAPSRCVTWRTSRSDRTWAIATSTWRVRATRSRSFLEPTSSAESSIEETAPLGRRRSADVPQSDGRARDDALAARAAGATPGDRAARRVARATSGGRPRTLDLDIVCFDAQTVNETGPRRAASGACRIDRSGSASSPSCEAKR